MAKKLLASFLCLFRRPPETPSAEESDLVKRLRELMNMTVQQASVDLYDGARRTSHSRLRESEPATTDVQDS